MGKCKNGRYPVHLMEYHYFHFWRRHHGIRRITILCAKCLPGSMILPITELNSILAWHPRRPNRDTTVHSNSRPSELGIDTGEGDEKYSQVGNLHDLQGQRLNTS